MLGWRDGSILAGGLSVAWALSCSSGFSTGERSAGGMSAGGQSAGSSAVAAGFGGAASDAGTSSGGGNAPSDAGAGGDSGESAEGGAGAAAGSTAGSTAGSNQTGGRSATGGMPSVAGMTGEGGAANAAGSGNTGGIGNPEPVSTDKLLYWFSADFGVTESEGAISKWLDRSGNHADAAQILPDSRPKLDRFAGSDLPAVVFDGQDDYLGMPPLIPDFAQGVTFLAVARATSGNACMALLELSNGSEIDDVAFFRDLEAFTYEVVTDVVHGQHGAFAVGEPRLLEVTHTPEAGVSLFMNGLATGAAAFALPSDTLRNQNFLGRSLYVNCQTWSGELAEVLLYGRTLPTDERQTIQRYLNEKWGCCGS
jgi:hypothetical protein